MASILPSFVRRFLALRRARRAVLEGENGEALDILRDPFLSLSARARELRETAFENLLRTASRAIASGDLAGAQVALGVVSRDDPARALEWGRKLALGTDPAAAPAAPPIERPLVRLLGEMRARAATAPDLSRADSRAAAPSNVERTLPAYEDLPTRAPRLVNAMSIELSDDPVYPRFRFEIDDVGELLAVSSDRLVIGHLRSDTADLRFLADVEAEHVRLVRRDAFHSGASWHIELALAREVRVNGRALTREPCGLFDGDEVELSRNVSFRFRQPEASSQSAVLELLRGAECEGALKILLFAPGEAGVVRIGSKKNRHIPLAECEHDVSLKLSGRELWVHCAGGVRLSDTARDAGGAVDAGATSATVILPCPPPAAQHLAVAARAHPRPTLGISLRPAPLERPHHPGDA